MDPDMLALWLLIAFVVLMAVGTWMSIAAKRPFEISAEMDRELAASAVDRAFGIGWSRVQGPGDLNRRLRIPLPVKWERPTLSVWVQAQGSGTLIRVQLTSWSTMLGLVNWSHFVLLKKAKINRRLSQSMARVQ